jgi:hypothetical protein
MGLKSLGIRGSFTFRLKRWVRGGNICRDMQLGIDHRNEGCKLGIEGFKLGSKVMFDGLVVEPDYLPNSEVFFSVVFIPHEYFTP